MSLHGLVLGHVAAITRYSPPPSGEVGIALTWRRIAAQQQRLRQRPRRGRWPPSLSLSRASRSRGLFKTTVAPASVVHALDAGFERREADADHAASATSITSSGIGCRRSRAARRRAVQGFGTGHEQPVADRELLPGLRGGFASNGALTGSVLRLPDAGLIGLYASRAAHCAARLLPVCNAEPLTPGIGPGSRPTWRRCATSRYRTASGSWSLMRRRQGVSGSCSMISRKTFRYLEAAGEQKHVGRLDAA